MSSNHELFDEEISLLKDLITSLTKESEGPINKYNLTGERILSAIMIKAILYI